MLTSTKVLSGGYLSLFPNNPTERYGSQLSSKRLIPAKTSSGAFRPRAMAAVCTPAETSESFYQLLGIPETGSISEIKKAYKQLARKYHPDVSPSGCTEEYTQRFIMVKEAYETLSDPQTRALYDMDLARGLQLNFSTTRRRYDQKMDEEKEWQRRWQAQVDNLMRRSMQKESASGPGRRKSTSWGNPTRRKRNSIFDLE